MPQSFPTQFVLTLLLALFLPYSAWLYVKSPQAGKADPRADRGKLLWQQHNCGACHQLYGLGGYLGPDLTNVYSLRGEAPIKGVIQSGTVVMPAFKLSEQELQDLLRFLQSTDQSGTADPRNFTLQPNGNIQALSH